MKEFLKLTGSAIKLVVAFKIADYIVDKALEKSSELIVSFKEGRDEKLTKTTKKRATS